MKRPLPFLTLFLCIALILIRVSSSAVFVNSAVERVQMYTHTCWNIDIECQEISPGVIQLENDADHELQLTLHLLGTAQVHTLHMITPLLVVSRLLSSRLMPRIEALYSAPEHPPKH